MNLAGKDIEVVVQKLYPCHFHSPIMVTIYYIIRNCNLVRPRRLSLSEPLAAKTDVTEPVEKTLYEIECIRIYSVKRTSHGPSSLRPGDSPGESEW